MGNHEFCNAYLARARQRGQLGSEIFDLEENLILNPEPGPDLKLSPETDPDTEFRNRAGPKNLKIGEIL